jgi:hypothetical protein
LYYDSKLRVIVDAKVDESKPEGVESAREKRARKLGIQREVVASAFAHESPEVKAEVSQELEALKSAKAALVLEKKQVRDDNAEDEPSPSDIVQYVFTSPFFLNNNHVSQGYPRVSCGHSNFP